MPDTLRRLLQTHEFLKQALDAHGSSMTSAAADRLCQERDRVFLELVEYSSSDVRVTLAQFNFLLTALAGLAEDPLQAELLRKTCLATAERLAAQAPLPPSVPNNAAAVAADGRGVMAGKPQISQIDINLLDSLSDRAAVYDREYRYVLTNKANAAFYGKQTQEFIDRPCWNLIGQKCFQEMTKPKLDACFAGRSSTHVAIHLIGDRSMLYHIAYSPVRDAIGNVTSVLVVARDVSQLPFAATMVWPSPDE